MSKPILDNEVDVIAHFGTLGMKWGVRKSSGGGKSSKGKELSDAELKSALSRLRMEKEYKGLTASETSAGQKFVSEVLLNSGKAVATTYATKAMTYAVEKAIKAAAKT